MSALAGPVFGVTLTTVTWWMALALHRRTGWVVFNPVLVAVALIIGVLHIAGISFDGYMQGGRLISFWLGPAVVALALPLSEQMDRLRGQLGALALSALAGAVVGIVSAVLVAKSLDASTLVTASLAPKSATTPIAMGVSEALGGAPALTAGLVVLTGILGAVLGPTWLTILRVVDPAARGLALGAGAHGVGTARALEEGPLQGAVSGLSMGLTGLLTALLTPPLMALLSP
ncbi:MAG: LrgB family protein [Bradymonadia bacterium]